MVFIFTEDVGLSMPYYNISKNEFERMLRYAMDPDFNIRNDVMSGSNLSEYVYSATVSNGFEIIIYSSISVHTDKARAKGNDAIRLKLYHESVRGSVGSEVKTLRTEKWAVNLQKKIENAVRKCDEALSCSECGRYLIERTSKNGEFLGCINFPQCSNSMNV